MIRESDIDWFCLVNGQPTHIASMGGMIPKQFCDSKELRSIQTVVAKMEPFVEVRLNYEILQSQVAEGYEYLQDEIIRVAVEEANKNNPGYLYLSGMEIAIRLFASSFVEKARRGFRSFAKLEGEEADVYVLIADPVNPLEYWEGMPELRSLKCELLDEGRRIVL